jgi:hypothetical protein
MNTSHKLDSSWKIYYYSLWQLCLKNKINISERIAQGEINYNLTDTA